MAETDAKSVMVGPEEMAAFFNRSVKTWRRWVRTGRAPLPDQVIGAEGVRAERGSVVTDAERLEWACEVLNREKWDDRAGWIHYRVASGAWRVASDGLYLSAFAAIAIALALDEQMRQKWPEMERAQWACQMLNRQEYRGLRWISGGYHAESVWGNAGEHILVTLDRSVAVAIAESLIRREMLGDTSDANLKEVKP